MRLAEDVQFCRPEDGELITSLADTVVDLLGFLIQKSEERLATLLNKMMGVDVNL